MFVCGAARFLRLCYRGRASRSAFHGNVFLDAATDARSTATANSETDTADYGHILPGRLSYHRELGWLLGHSVRIAIRGTGRVHSEERRFDMRVFRREPHDTDVSAANRRSMRTGAVVHMWFAGQLVCVHRAENGRQRLFHGALLVADANDGTPNDTAERRVQQAVRTQRRQHVPGARRDVRGGYVPATTLSVVQVDRRRRR